MSLSSVFWSVVSLFLGSSSRQFTIQEISVSNGITTIAGKSSGSIVHVGEVDLPVINGAFRGRFRFTSRNEIQDIAIQSDGIQRTIRIRQPSPFQLQAKAVGVSLSQNGVNQKAYRKLSHTRKVPPLPEIFDERTGRIFYFNGMLPIISSRALWNRVRKAGRVPRYGGNQCAVTVAAYLELASIRSKVDITSYVNKHERGTDSTVSCTDQIETLLRGLGWNYYEDRTWVAPLGAPSLGDKRKKGCGVPQHSPHVFVMTEDRGAYANDLISDNMGWNRMYRKSSDGFWLPPGVYPRKREP